MPAYIDQSLEEFHNRVHIANLPVDISAKQIREIFGQFGIIVKLSLKRRLTQDSPVLLPNPFVILIFEKRESVDRIMSERPYFMKDTELFVRRCLPMTRRYPYETDLTTNKMLVRIPQENHQEILPNDDIIVNYFKAAGERILRLERWEDKTVFVEFDDYDCVDRCCLLRPHLIADQMIEVEKCADEQQARRRAQFRQKTRSVSLKLSPKSTVVNTSISTGDTISPTLVLHRDDQAAQLQLTYGDITDNAEDKHQRLISSLKAELEQIMKERIRLQRLTLDYQQDQNRLTEENRRWKKLYDESLLEQSRVQNEGQHALLKAMEK